MKKHWKFILTITAAAYLISACGVAAEPLLPTDPTSTMSMTGMPPSTTEPEPVETMPAMGPMGSMSEMSAMSGGFATDELAPLVPGLYEGENIFFIHTEASDSVVAQLLTEMMGPKVVVVPELAQAPAALVGNVYVFADGIPGHGPMGFQPDVFDSVPGDPAYRPLRLIQRVSWREGAAARQLNSAAEIAEAELNGEITIEPTSIVVNMPILVWPGPDGVNHR